MRRASTARVGLCLVPGLAFSFVLAACGGQDGPVIVGDGGVQDGTVAVSDGSVQDGTAAVSDGSVQDGTVGVSDGSAQDGSAAPDSGCSQEACGCSDAGTACGSICCAPGQSCTAGQCAVPVSSAAATTLMLWLTADRGLQCGEDNLATGWVDQSGHGNNASTTSTSPLPDGGAVGAHTGPTCNAASHTINGISVPYFTDANDGPPYVSGTFDVNLGFLTGSPFTIFMVERRWSGMRANDTPNLALGTQSPSDPPSTGQPAPFSTLQVGYVAYNTGSTGAHCPQLSVDLGNWGTQNVVPANDAGTAAPLSMDTFRMGPTTGLHAWINGYLQLGSNGSQVLSATYGADQTLGSIGRAAYVNYRDERFNGDIAEVLVFDSELSESDRQAVETYLEAHWGSVTSLTSGGGCP